MNKALLFTLLILFALSCTGNSPLIIAENEEVQVLLKKDTKTEDGHVSLWVRYNNTGKEKRFLIVHPKARRDWFTLDSAMRVHVDSISDIQKVTIISWQDEPIKLLVEGCRDHRNVESRIITIGEDIAICLPTNRGLLGISEEETLLIMQSYDYYKGGGRFNIIEAFDLDGNRLSSMSPKLTPQYDTYHE